MKVPNAGPATWLTRAARAWPGLIALKTDGETLSFIDLAHYLDSLCSRLFPEDLSLSRGLAVVSPRNQDLARGAYLALRCGTSYLPVHPDFGSIRGLLDSTGIRQALVDPAWTLQLPPECLTESTGLFQSDRLHSGPKRTGQRGTTPGLYIATSGTENPARAVELTEANLEASVTSSKHRIPIEPGDAWLAVLPMHHVGGLMILYRCLEAGATLVVRDTFRPDEVWGLIYDKAVTHLSLVPAMLSRILEESGQTPPPPMLKAVLIGGGPLERELAEQGVAAGWPLFVTYGMTETCSQIATRAVPSHGWSPGDVGHPIPEVQVDIVDRNGLPCPGPGLIRIAGPVVMRGYTSSPNPVEAGLVDGRLITRDLGFMDESGHLHVLGRADDVIVTGGENVHPESVEGRLRAYPGIEDVGVTGVEDRRWGKRLVALVVGNVDANSILQWCGHQLPPPWRPRQVFVVDLIPRTALGKPRRHELSALALALMNRAGSLQDSP